MYWPSLLPHPAKSKETTLIRLGIRYLSSSLAPTRHPVLGCRYITH